MRISGHKTEAVFRRYDITAEADLLEAAEKLERFATASPPQNQSGRANSTEIAQPRGVTPSTETNWN
jgi:hypothetical protein